MLGGKNLKMKKQKTNWFKFIGLCFIISYPYMAIVSFLSSTYFDNQIQRGIAVFYGLSMFIVGFYKTQIVKFLLKYCFLNVGKQQVYIFISNLY